jgi:hypothetical protein
MSVHDVNMNRQEAEILVGLLAWNVYYRVHTVEDECEGGYLLSQIATTFGMEDPVDEEGHPKDWTINLARTIEADRLKATADNMSGFALDAKVTR